MVIEGLNDHAKAAGGLLVLSFTESIVDSFWPCSFACNEGGISISIDFHPEG